MLHVSWCLLAMLVGTTAGPQSCTAQQKTAYFVDEYDTALTCLIDVSSRLCMSFDRELEV